MASDEFNQPIHQVLSDYDLLEVAKCEDVNFSLDQPLSWRMNLCAISQLYPSKYFIAVNNKVCVYGLTGSLVFTPQPIMVLKPSTDPEFMINAIKLGEMKLSPNQPTGEILTAVGDNGEIFAWNTHDLFSSSSTCTKPFLHRHNVGSTPTDDNDENSDDASAWGIAMHVNGLIAVSANNHRVTIYNLWSAYNDSTYPQNSLGQRGQVELAGHVHNIPCVDFDSSGRYLASGSIDMTCRLWDLSTLQQVGKRFMTRTLDSDAWLWGIKFIPTGHFKSATCDSSSTLAKTLRRYRQQGRATGLTDLHMEHSATYPIYQLDMQQMFHRLNTGDVTDEEEEDDDDGDGPGNNLIRLSALLSRHLQRARSIDDDDDDDDDMVDDGDLAVDDVYPPIDTATAEETTWDDPQPDEDDDGEPQTVNASFPLDRFQDIDDDIADAALLDWEEHLDNHGEMEDLEDQWYPNGGGGAADDDDDEYDDNYDDDDDGGGPIDYTEWPSWEEGDDDGGYVDDDSYGGSPLDDRLAHLPEWNNDWNNDANQHADDSNTDLDHADDGDVGSHLDGRLDHLQEWNSNGNQHVDDGDDDFSEQGDDGDDYVSGWDTSHPMVYNDTSQPDIVPGGWDSNQREDYDDLLAEEEGWMQDRSQFPWHWVGVRGGTNDQDVSSLLQDGDATGQDDTTRNDGDTKTTPPTFNNLEPTVLYPPTDSDIPYVFEPTGPAPPPTPSLTDYLMITSKKDAYLLHPTNRQGQWTMATVQRERRVVSRADARTAFVLDMMERLSFVEWIPDLELCVVASQKGCVALMRVLQVQMHHQQTCLFNHEKYIPLHGLQNSVLYGMTVHRLPSEQQQQQDPVYQLSLLYLDGTMRSYRLSKPSRSSLLDLSSVL